MNKTNQPTSDKPTLRKIVQEKLALMRSEEKKEASQNICEQLQKIIGIKKPETLILYNPLSDEVDISNLGEYFTSQCKIVTVGHDGSCAPFENTEKTLALIPGRAFTQDGKRIGRGSGYYDIFLSNHSRIQTLGVCFACQVFENIPEDPWDIKMTQVVFG